MLEALPLLTQISTHAHRPEVVGSFKALHLFYVVLILLIVYQARLVFIAHDLHVRFGTQSGLCVLVCVWQGEGTHDAQQIEGLSYTEKGMREHSRSVYRTSNAWTQLFSAKHTDLHLVVRGHIACLLLIHPASVENKAAQELVVGLGVLFRLLVCKVGVEELQSKG